MILNCISKVIEGLSGKDIKFCAVNFSILINAVCNKVQAFRVEMLQCVWSRGFREQRQIRYARWFPLLQWVSDTD